MADETEVTAPETVAEQPAVEVVAQVEQPTTETQPEPAKEHGNKGKDPWFMGRINEETNRRQALEENLRVERDRAASLEAIIARMQAGDKPTEQPKSAPRSDRPATYQDDVKAEAAKQRFIEETWTIKNAGLRDFPNFEESLRILNAVGATGDDFVMDVLAVDKDNAHKMLDKLAKDPERAASLVGMDSRRRTAELTRMSMAEQKTAAPVTEPAPKQTISRAPAPKPALSPTAAAPEVDPRTPEGNEKMDDRQWEAWYKSAHKDGHPFRAA